MQLLQLWGFNFQQISQYPGLTKEQSNKAKNKNSLESSFVAKLLYHDLMQSFFLLHRKLRSLFECFSSMVK